MPHPSCQTQCPPLVLPAVLQTPTPDSSITHGPFRGLPPPTLSLTKLAPTYHQWHLKMDHHHPTRLHFMAKNSLATNLPPPLSKLPTPLTCSGCAVSKQPHAPLSCRQLSAPTGSHLYTDVCGPVKPPIIHNKRYFITSLYKTSKNSSYFFPTKSAVLQTVVQRF